ncbi:MAG: 3'-5' exonuclease [Agitococcus sp.]|nr:3'-5' exonuclease [Agitococcus sp.]
MALKPYVVALDLEMNQPSGSIIQIGAVLGDCRTGEIISTLSCMVNPQEVLSADITALTGITQQQVDTAQPLVQVADVLEQWLAPWKKQRLLNPVTWGGGDSLTLQRQLGLNDEDFSRYFGRRWLDAKTVYSAWAIRQGKEPFGGLEKAMHRLGLTFEGRAHDALVDAHNTFRVWHHLITLFPLSLSPSNKVKAIV